MTGRAAAAAAVVVGRPHQPGFPTRFCRRGIHFFPPCISLNPGTYCTWDREDASKKRSTWPTYYPLSPAGRRICPGTAVVLSCGQARKEEWEWSVAKVLPPLATPAVVTKDVSEPLGLAPPKRLLVGRWQQCDSVVCHRVSSSLFFLCVWLFVTAVHIVIMLVS